MDIRSLGRLANSKDYPGVTFGQNVVLYGKVKIGRGSQIGDFSILGMPSADHVSEKLKLGETRIGRNVFIGPHCVINNGAQIGSRVRVEEYCKVGWKTKVGNGSQIIYGAHLHYRVRIGSQSIIGGFCCDRAVIGDKTVMFGKLIHQFHPKLIKRFSDPIRLFNSGINEPSPNIGDRSVVGFDALIVGGIKVGRGAYIAAQAIVTKNVAKGKFVKGIL